MEVYVSVEFSRWEDKAKGYVSTERTVRLNTLAGETVGQFADRACDILMPRAAHTERMTPAQFRRTCCLSLARRTNGFVIAEETVIDGEVLPFFTGGDQFQLKPPR